MIHILDGIVFYICLNVKMCKCNPNDIYPFLENNNGTGSSLFRFLKDQSHS